MLIRRAGHVQGARAEQAVDTAGNTAWCCRHGAHILSSGLRVELQPRAPVLGLTVGFITRVYNEALDSRRIYCMLGTEPPGQVYWCEVSMLFPLILRIVPMAVKLLPAI